MYGLPKTFDGHLFVGHRLEMVCFSANQVFLHFDRKLIITIEGSFLYRNDRSPNDNSVVELPVSKSNLMGLLEKVILDVSWSENGTLTLFFENDCIFECYDTFPNYESYQIRYEDKVIIV